MRDKILHNERYGVLEINKEGIITGCNKQAGSLLSEFCKRNSISDLAGLDVFSYSGDDEKICRDCSTPAEIISSISGVTLVDTFSCPETDSEIIRFTCSDSGLFPFLNLIRYSSSVLFELDKDLSFIFASESFFNISGMERTGVYGVNLSYLTSDKVFNRFRTSIEETGDDRRNFFEVWEFLFFFDGIVPGYNVEVYPVFLSGTELCGYLCFIPDSTLHRKCRELDLTLNRMNEVVNFAGTISHDCNNALTAVLGNISLAKMESQGIGELEELLADAESAALKIKSLTEKLGVFIRSMKPQNK